MLLYNALHCMFFFVKISQHSISYNRILATSILMQSDWLSWLDT